MKAETATASEEGRHFPTSSVSPMGILAFGHSLSTDASTGRANLTHSICAVPTGDTQLPEPLWARLKSDIVESVNALAATTEAEQVPA